MLVERRRVVHRYQVVSAWRRRPVFCPLHHSVVLCSPRSRTIFPTVLARAMRDPDAEFRTRYHQTTHNIHYATARRDLMELHEKGYLDMELPGKAYVFTRGSRLEELATTSALESPE